MDPRQPAVLSLILSIFVCLDKCYFVVQLNKHLEQLQQLVGQLLKAIQEEGLLALLLVRGHGDK